MAIAASGTMPAIDDVQLAAVVRTAFDEPTATVEDGWSCRPLAGGLGEGVGIWRLDGAVRVGTDRRPWSLVLKSLPGGDGAPTWDDPRREADVYRSGVLTTLPGGLVAPRCFATEDRPDGTTWLWLEAIADDPAPWPDSQYALAAEALGRFNGTYLTGTPLPSAPWLSRAWLRCWVERSGPAIADLRRFAGEGASPLMRRAFPRSRVAALTRLWDERDDFFATLDRLPQTFCHLDAFRGNMLGQPGTAESSWPVLIDWAFAGIGSVGEDLVPLVLMAFLHEDIAGLRRLDTVCFAAYLAGLRTAGWDGDAELVRLGYAAAAALRYSIGPVGFILSMTADPALHPLSERMFGRPAGELITATNALWAFEDELAAEARSLISRVA